MLNLFAYEQNIRKQRIMTLELEAGFEIETDAEFRHYKKDDIIIEEGNRALHFYYLLKGEVSVYNIAKEGKIFLHHKVQENNFFGEPATLLDIPFPGYINVTSDTAEVLKIKRENLMGYLLAHPQWTLEFLKIVAEKSLRKSELLESIIFLNPEERIIKHFDDFKKGAEEKMVIDMTRKELSIMTGLRIETIIRTIKKMEKDGKLEIISGKVYY